MVHDSIGHLGHHDLLQAGGARRAQRMHRHIHVRGLAVLVHARLQLRIQVARLRSRQHPVRVHLRGSSFPSACVLCAAEAMGQLQVRHARQRHGTRQAN